MLFIHFFKHEILLKRRCDELKKEVVLKCVHVLLGGGKSLMVRVVLALLQPCTHVPLDGEKGLWLDCVSFVQFFMHISRSF